MNELRKVEPKEIQGNVFTMISQGWGLVTAGTPQDFNTMTVSWGGLGFLWARPVCNVYVRESRHTYRYMEEGEYFTLSLFAPGEYRDQLKVLGSKSGRDMDKMHDSGLTPIEVEGQMAFAEAETVLVCRKLYSKLFDAEQLPAEVMASAYSGINEGDLHKEYIAEIVSAYVK